MTTQKQNGTVILVGAGPGHPDYLTVRGLRELQAADVIVYDALLDQSFKFLFPKKAEKIFAGKRAGKHKLTQDQINALLIQKARQGKRVVRLKGGDPLLYGRGGEEWLTLAEAGIRVEVVPGVSALGAAGGLSGIPLTHRGVANAVMVLECHRESLESFDWQKVAGFVESFDGTLAIFMGTRVIQEIARRLLENGANQNHAVALVENGSMINQAVSLSTLGEVAERGLPARTGGPGIIYIGETVHLRGRLQTAIAKGAVENIVNAGVMHA